MKKVLALIMALVLVLSLVACENKEEKKRVDSALQGEWFRIVGSGMFMNTYTFTNGMYSFNSEGLYLYESKSHEEGTYKINTSKHRIDCGEKILSYQYDDGILTLLEYDLSEDRFIELSKQ